MVSTNGMTLSHHGVNQWHDIILSLVDMSTNGMTLFHHGINQWHDIISS